jgi:hypothetical protein
VLIKTKENKMNIDKITLENAKKIRKILENELPSILEKYGLKFELGNITYDDYAHWVKFNNFRIVPKDALSEEEALLVKFKSDVFDLDKIVQVGGKKVKLFGFKPKRRKFPYIVVDVENPNNKYKYTEEYAKQFFSK